MRKHTAILIVLLSLLSCLPAASVETVTFPLRADTETKTGSVVISLDKDKSPQTSKAMSTDVAPGNHGVVVDQNGKPIPYATVFVPAPPKAKPGKSIVVYSSAPMDSYARTTADKNGAFPYSPGSWPRPIAVAKGYSYGEAPYGGDKNAPIKIKLWPEYTVKGRVIDETGKPVLGALVKVHDLFGGTDFQQPLLYPNDWAPNQATTCKNGSFTLSHLPSPTRFESWDLQLIVAKDGRASVRKSISKHSLSAVEITEPLACTVEGTVYLPGKHEFAPAGTRLRVYAQSQYGWEPQDVQTSSDGTFRLTGLPPGTAGIQLVPPEYSWPNGVPTAPAISPWTATALNVILDPRNPLKVEMILSPGAVIRGNVKKQWDGLPAKGARLTISHSGVSDVGYQETAYTDANGDFAARVAPGDAVITLQEYGSGSYYDQAGPSRIALKAREGEDKSGVQIIATRYEYTDKLIADDLEIKPGTYELRWDKDLTYAGHGIMGTGDLQPKAVFALLRGRPRKASKSIIYRAYSIDGRGAAGTLIIALDKSMSGSRHYDTLYVDRNRNFDLSDDEPMGIAANEATSRIWMAVRAGQGSRSPNEETLVSVHVSLLGENAVRTYVEKKGGWVGHVETNVGRIDCAIGDSNYSGSYGDSTAKSPSDPVATNSDLLFLDDTGLGRLDTDAYGPTCVRIYPISRIGGRFYKLWVNPAGDRISIEPYKGPTGRVRVTAESTRGLDGEATFFSLISSEALFDFAYSGSKPVSVPAGYYQGINCDLHITAKNQKNPVFAECKIRRPIEVKANTENVVRVSGPASLSIDPDPGSPVWQSGKSNFFNWSIRVGNDTTIKSFSGKPALPRLSFINDKGKIVRRVEAGYT